MKFFVNWNPLRIRVCSRNTQPHLEVGLGIPRRTQILSGTQFTTHFIELFVVEMKRFVGSTVNVISCGQRSSKAAECKHRALGNYLSERICYMILISKCRRD